MIQKIEDTVRGINEFFSMIIQDSLGRFVFLQLPFWAIIYHLLWGIIAYWVPYLVVGALVLVGMPFVAGEIIYKYYSDVSRQSFKIAIGVGLFIQLLLVGIPNVALGLFFRAWATKGVGNVYWGVIKSWWGFFNAINHFADNTVPFKNYDFNFIILQWVFWAAAVGLTWMFFNDAKKSREEDERKAQFTRAKAHEEMAKELRNREEQRIRDENYWKRQAEKERQEMELEAAKQKKIEETKGEDPWDSGFL